MKIGRTNLCEQITDAEALPNRVAVTWDHDGFRPLTQTERILSAESPQGTVDERFFAIASDGVSRGDLARCRTIGAQGGDSLSGCPAELAVHDDRQRRRHLVGNPGELQGCERGSPVRPHEYLPDVGAGRVMDLCVYGHERFRQCCMLARFPDLQVDADGVGPPGGDHLGAVQLIPQLRRAVELRRQDVFKHCALVGVQRARVDGKRSHAPILRWRWQTAQLLNRPSPGAARQRHHDRSWVGICRSDSCRMIHGQWSSRFCRPSARAGRAVAPRRLAKGRN